MQPWNRRLFKNPIELSSPMENLWQKYRGNILYLKYIQRLVPASISLDNTEMYRCASQNNVHEHLPKHYLWCKLKIIIDIVLFILRYRISSCGINDIKVRTHRYLFPCDTKQREQRWARLIQMFMLSQMKMIDKSSFFINIFFKSYINDEIFLFTPMLFTQWGRVMHMYVSKLPFLGSNNGSSTGRRHTIIWISDGILILESLKTNLSEVYFID